MSQITLGPLPRGFTRRRRLSCQSRSQCIVTSGIHLILCPVVSLVGTAWDPGMVPVVMGQTFR